jgi:hypothetical protein
MNAAVTDEEQKALEQTLVGLEVSLRRKQDIWEHPRNIAILAGAVATIAGVGGGFIGFKIGQTPSPAPIIIQVPASK